MNAWRLFACLALGAAAATFTGCFGGEDEESDTGYTPNFTEPKGTAHDGDFFPLVAGRSRSLRGTQSGTLRRQASGVDEGQPVSQDETRTMDATFLGRVETRPASTLTLSNGTFTAFPVTTTTQTEAEDGEVSTTTEYYEKTDAAINLLGTEEDGSVLSEASDPIFLRLPLKVGDKWDNVSKEAPDVASGDNMEMTIRSRTFVVGMETVTDGIRSYSALRLDQSVIITGSGVENGVPIAVKGEGLAILHLVEGEGQVRQRNSIKVVSTATVSQEATRVSIVATMNLDTDISWEEEPVTLAAAPARAKIPAAASPRSASGAVEAAARAAGEAAMRGLKLRMP